MYSYDISIKFFWSEVKFELDISLLEQIPNLSTLIPNLTHKSLILLRSFLILLRLFLIQHTNP